MRQTYHIILVLILFSISIIPLNAQDYPLSKIIDSVNVGSSVNETFELYLPSSYDDTKPSPVIYIFDPAARGKIGIEVFVNVAEKFGYILACSNNTRNGQSWQINFEIAKRMIADIKSKFLINDDQIYLAGFSGGARLAASLLTQGVKVEGVLACGAGFASNIEYRPYQKENYSFCAIAGWNDFNFLGLKKDMDWLKQISVSHMFISFDGKHNWPPDTKILEAFNWFNIELIRKEKREKNEDFISRIFLDWAAKAEFLENENELVEAYNLYENIQKSFDGLKDISGVSARMDDIIDNRKFNKQLEELLDAEENEDRMYYNYYRAFNDNIRHPHDSLIAIWENEIRTLNYMLESKNILKQRLAYRILSGISVLSYETAKSIESTNQYDKLAFIHQLRILIQPHNPGIYLELAKYNVLMNEHRRAISNIEKAIKKGYSDKAYLLNNEVFKKLVDNKRFAKVLSKIDHP